MRRLLLPGLAAALAAACSSGTMDLSGPDHGSVVTGATGTSVLATTEPTTATTVSFDTEVRRAAIALLEVRNDVLQHPELARVGEYIADTCTCLERERRIVEEFVAEGLRWSDSAVIPRGIIVETSRPSEVTVSLVGRQPETTIVDGAGVTVEAVPLIETAAYRATIARENDGRWLITALSGVSLNEADTARVLAAGLP